MNIEAVHLTCEGSGALAVTYNENTGRYTLKCTGCEEVFCMELDATKEKTDFTCKRCEGCGMVTTEFSTTMDNTVECPECKGSGRTDTTRIGSFRVSDDTKLNVGTCTCATTVGVHTPDCMFTLLEAK